MLKYQGHRFKDPHQEPDDSKTHDTITLWSC